MAERTPWWWPFFGKKKSGGSKDTGVSQPPGPEFDPFAPAAQKPKDPVATSNTPSDPSPSQTQPGPSGSGDDTYDDSQLESVFNEQSCRRNMRVSRSGRFKEKRKVRSSLPIEEKETDKVSSAKDDRR